MANMPDAIIKFKPSLSKLIKYELRDLALRCSRRALIDISGKSWKIGKLWFSNGSGIAGKMENKWIWGGIID